MKESLVIKTKIGCSLLIYLVLLAASLTKFILSFEYYSDEYGTDISFSKGSLFFIVISIIGIGFSIYLLVNSLKDKKVDLNLIKVSCFINLLIATFYYLGQVIDLGTDGLEYTNQIIIFFILVSFLIYVGFEVYLAYFNKSESKK